MTTEIATIEASQFLALDRPSTEIQGIIQDNLAGQEIGEFDLPRITVPAGGGTVWQLESPLTGTQSFDKLDGILVFQRPTRAYWESDETTGSPPDCSSRDGVVGVGKPGGECRICPLSQFGSDPKAGRGQACKQGLAWFLLREDSFLPVVLGLPPTSLKAAREYTLALGGAGIRASEVITTIALEKETNPDGQKFSKAVPTLGAKLDPAAVERAREYADALRPVFEAAPVDRPPVPAGAAAAAAETE